MFFKIIRTKKYEAKLKRVREEGKYEGKYEGFEEGRRETIKLIRDILMQKDKVYLKGMTLKGSHQLISNVAFLGCDTGIKIEPGTEDIKVKDNFFIS